MSANPISGNFRSKVFARDFFNKLIRYLRYRSAFAPSFGRHPHSQHIFLRSDAPTSLHEDPGKKEKGSVSVSLKTVLGSGDVIPSTGRGLNLFFPLLLDVFLCKLSRLPPIMLFAPAAQSWESVALGHFRYHTSCDVGTHFLSKRNRFCRKELLKLSEITTIGAREIAILDG